MNTKSMILALNSLLLFNSVNPWFGISSWRKKLGDTCAALGKKSVAFISLILAALVVSLSAKGAALGGAFALVTKRTPLRSRQAFPRYAGPSVHYDRRHQTHQEVETQPAARASAFSCAVSMHNQRHDPFPFVVSDPSVHQESLNEVFHKGKECLNSTYTQLLLPALYRIKYKQQFQKVLKDIRHNRFILHCLPKKLRGTLLDRIPYLARGDKKRVPVYGSCGAVSTITIELPMKNSDGSWRTKVVRSDKGVSYTHQIIPNDIMRLITQFVCEGDLYHERSFYDPLHHSDLYLLRGESQDYLRHKQRVSINFVDGNPRILELVLCSPAQKRQYDESPTYAPADVITINTSDFSQTRKKKDSRSAFVQYRSEHPTSYIQRVVSTRCSGTDAFLKVPPLTKQFTSIDHEDLILVYWAPNEMTDEDRHPYRFYSESGIGRFFSYGIQRNLSRGRVVWCLPKGNHVGIYEKAQEWFDEDCALEHDKFDSVTQDRSGDTFHLVQIIEEQTPVLTASLPRTPAYIKDKDGNEIKGCLGYPPKGATAHLREEHEYPEDIEAVALGFNSTQTNNRCSLYKQRGESLKDYPPELLLYQKELLTPSRKKEMLYPDEPVKMPYNTVDLSILRAQRCYRSYILGEQSGVLE